jgi:hypothetical protein
VSLLFGRPSIGRASLSADSQQRSSLLTPIPFIRNPPLTAFKQSAEGAEADQQLSVHSRKATERDSGHTFYMSAAQAAAENPSAHSVTVHDSLPAHLSSSSSSTVISDWLCEGCSQWIAASAAVSLQLATSGARRVVVCACNFARDRYVCLSNGVNLSVSDSRCVV